MSENTSSRYEADREPFYLEFYNKIERILSLGDDAGNCFSVYFVKSIWAGEVFFSLLPKFQVRHEG